MKEYELVREIFNLCEGNQMRDVFIEEIETDNPEEYVKSKHKERNITYTKNQKDEKTVIIDVYLAGMRQRYSFTEI